MKINDKDLEIDNSSMYALEQEIISYSRKLQEFGRLYAEATKLLSKAELELEIISSELVSIVRLEQKIPASSLQEARRSLITKYPEYQKAKEKVIKAAEDMNLARSAYYAMTYKNDRIKEIFRLELKKLGPDNATIGGGYQEKLNQPIMDVD